MIIGIISQKGGVGKSTLARMVACEYAANEWTVLIADLDVLQGTSYRWHERRLQSGLEPEVTVQQFKTVSAARRVAERYDLVIFDGKPYSTRENLEIAQASDLVILPTGLALDDLGPTVRLAHELIEKGIPLDRIVIAFCRVGDSDFELLEARTYVENAGYFCLSGFLPERTGYRRASDTGRAATETLYPSLNQRADELVQSIVNRIEENANG